MAASPLPGRSAFGWHSGERAVQELLGASTASRPNPTSLEFPPAHGFRIASNHLLALGALDDEGRPWSTIWGGERGFAQRIAKGVLGIRTLVDRQYDPVAQALLGSAARGNPVRPDDVTTGYKFMSGMSIDFDSRDRVKVMGRLLTSEVGDDDKVGEVQLAMVVQESTGNCPKYINKRDVRAHVSSPRLLSDSLPLPQQAVDLIHKADLFFMSSTNGDSMDTNHRGGPVGFMRLASNEIDKDGSGGVVLVYPEYSGNRLYQSLGNLYLNPKIGIAIPDFDTSDVLYLTGTAQLLLGEAATAVMPHCKLVLQIRVQEARLVADGLPFRGQLGEMSPYDPPLRALVGEAGVLNDAASSAVATAELLKREIITPSISRFIFALHPSATSAASTATPQGSGRLAVKPWLAGQHVTLDFSGELDHGYMHMNNDNPQSLNDDYVRTFTVTNYPPAHLYGDETDMDDGTQVEITVRKHGPATTFLWGYDMRKPLKLPVLGFGGDDNFRLPTAYTENTLRSRNQSIFIAAGVGVTPLLAQAAGVLAAEDGAADGGQEPGLRVLWSLRAEDLALAVDVLSRIPGLASRTRLFVTGKMDSSKYLLEEVRAMGAEVITRRIAEHDVLAPSREPKGRTKYYICTGTELSKVLLVWLAGQTTVSENFAY
ncbi:hypothetical protein CONLIGDRAFT_702726 [Coniochaeta ligniaria NRRL 30616]|uniref:FAD-binding FR-type domain-containing protein n=1 Tax=Coniochaeta ligniaria NRRL 30616 TaxID=1408157 RepID=A0A1J7IS54_9PEZI|nr:hypothetical protein CONLIGDRAFT_702726 [Coniochaeta ligniaria NRRL 30616]